MTRYVAFLSYSHRNRVETEWLHKALESYRIPRKLVGTRTAKGLVPARLIPIFRDRDELGAAADLGEQLRDALANSGHLVVIASPAANASKWVNEEIRSYKAIHGEDRVLALIVDGEPWASNDPERAGSEAFPQALRYRLGPDGAIGDTLAEPIAADMRPQGDGKRLALQKLVAGITGLRLDDLVRREAQRRTRRLTIIVTTLSIGLVLTSGLAVYAEWQRREAVQQRRIAERETAAARAATDYLIGTFELSNPATENPRTVTLVTILGRSAERARTELQEQPAIEARLVTAVGNVYNNLGLLDEAELALVRAMPAIKRAGPEGTAALVTLANTYFKKGELPRAEKLLSEADTMLGSDQAQYPALRAQVRATTGDIAYGKGEAEAALVAYDEALRLQRESPSLDRSVEAELLEGRGRILVDLGRHAEAEASLQEARSLFAAYRGEKHLWSGRAWYALALVAYASGDLPASQQRIDRSISILSNMLDQTNPILADALSLKGSIHQARGQMVPAERSLVAAIAAYRKVYGRPHYNIGIAEYYRAQVAFKEGRLADAMRRLDDAQINYEASYGPVHPNLGELRVSRAELLAAAGRQGEAATECRDGIAMLVETMGADASFTRGLKATCDQITASNRAG